ncbi:MAG: hypothetical protein AAB802_04575 [Patescibacteria group bacterium]
MSAELDFKHEDDATENFRRGGVPKKEEGEKEPQDEVSLMVRALRETVGAGDFADEEWQDK